MQLFLTNLSSVDRGYPETLFQVFETKSDEIILRYLDRAKNEIVLCACVVHFKQLKSIIAMQRVSQIHISNVRLPSCSIPINMVSTRKRILKELERRERNKHMNIKLHFIALFCTQAIHKSG